MQNNIKNGNGKGLLMQITFILQFFYLNFTATLDDGGNLRFMIPTPT